MCRNKVLNPKRSRGAKKHVKIRRARKG